MLASLTRTTAGLSLRTRCVSRLGRTALSVQGPRILSIPLAIGRVVSRHEHHTSSNKDGPIGVSAALSASSKDSEDPDKHPTIFTSEFSLQDRVALVTGGNRGIGLEMALSFLEAGARAVYTVDLPQEPSEGWHTVQKFVSTMQMPDDGKPGRLEYICGDVTDQQRMWKMAEEIGDKEQRLDVCVAAAGVGTDSIDCLEYPADVHRNIMEINTTGVLFTAQAAGRQMVRFGNGGSIILIASAAGSIAIPFMGAVAYNTSKGAVLQMTRSMACELAPRKIRVNSISPGWIYTPMTDAMIENDPAYFERITPMARVGRPHELRGAAVWLASDASSFCTGSNIPVDGGVTAW